MLAAVEVLQGQDDFMRGWRETLVRGREGSKGKEKKRRERNGIGKAELQELIYSLGRRREFWLVDTWSSLGYARRWLQGFP